MVVGLLAESERLGLGIMRDGSSFYALDSFNPEGKKISDCEEGRAYMGMMGFKVRINRHGELLEVVQPGAIDPDE